MAAAKSNTSNVATSTLPNGSNHQNQSVGDTLIYASNTSAVAERLKHGNKWAYVEVDIPCLSPLTQTDIVFAG
jgi:hypothetical protein